MINIVINLKVEGIHQWKECDIEEVSFLKNPHRHLFNIKIKKAVSHEDRDIEIIKMKREVLSYLHGKYGEVCAFGNMSCEAIALNLCNEFSLSYCEVLEDGENGAEVYV